MIRKKKLEEDNNFIKFYNFEDFNIFVEPFCGNNISPELVIHYKNNKEYRITGKQMDVCGYIDKNVKNIEHVKLYRPVSNIDPLVLASILNRGLNYTPRVRYSNRTNKNNRNRYKKK